MEAGSGDKPLPAGSEPIRRTDGSGRPGADPSGRALSIPAEIGPGETERSRRNWQRWETLSGREQDIIAYICLQYTNRQIAVIMKIPVNTVNWYIRKILEKFTFHSKAAIQIKFSGWDFSNWSTRNQE